MRIVKIILFSLNYLFVALFVTFQALFYDALVNGSQKLCIFKKNNFRLLQKIPENNIYNQIVYIKKGPF